MSPARPSVAVIMFPGTNCEEETLRAVKDAGMGGRIVRWNEEPSALDSFSAYVIPGGWSYEDRVRAGAIAAKDPVLGKIRLEAGRGKPVLGICNGCQILAEAELIPNIFRGVEVGLAPNTNPFVSGYYCAWVALKVATKKKNAFTSKLSFGEVVRMPVAHGEGRFVSEDSEVLKRIEEEDLIAFKYSDENGDVVESFPINPNGSVLNIAALINRKGNVMAIMPHPERAFYMRQVPGFRGSFEESLLAGPGRAIFESLRDYLREREG